MQTSLYIHMPWCIKKCPYCDFNSHQSEKELPEANYIENLRKDLQEQQILTQNRPIHSIFIGGGTPSLFSAQSYHDLFSMINKTLSLTPNLEITLEANPGASEQQRFIGYRQAGINRLSLGVQSFQDDKLKALGRIHHADNAIAAVTMAKNAGFTNFNIDLMFGLPNQSVDDALFDLQTAIDLEPTHISWYQLTLEPNTYFHKFPPKLPEHDLISDIQEAGQTLLAKHGFLQYEISAYAKANVTCQHNMNYWQFGDYLGIGAGAHGKITNHKTRTILRSSNYKNPKDYMNPDKTACQTRRAINHKEQLFEYMLNRLRLNQPFTMDDIEAKIFTPTDEIKRLLEIAIAEGYFVQDEHDLYEKTEKGKNFLDECLQLFL